MSRHFKTVTFPKGHHVYAIEYVVKDFGPMRYELVADSVESARVKVAEKNTQHYGVDGWSWAQS